MSDLLRIAGASTPSRTGSWVTRLAGIVVWLVVWSGLVTALKPQNDLVPSPFDVAEMFYWMMTHSIGAGPLWLHAGWSILRFGAGFLLACLLGVPLGLVMGYLPSVRHIVHPIFELFRNVPALAWAPFSLLWFGATFNSQAFVIFAGALPPILLNSYHGIREMDPALINAARMLGANRATILFSVALRAAMPTIVAGLRIGMTNGWLSLVGAEIISGPGTLSGLGFLILVGQQNLQASISICAMMVIGLIGTALELVLRRLEARCN